MSPTSSIALAIGLVLLGLAVLALAIRRHRGGRHRAPEPVTTVLAARTGVGAVTVGSVASSVLVLVGHGAGTGSTVQAADRSPHGAFETTMAPDGGSPAPVAEPAHADRSGPAEGSARSGGGYVVVPAPRSPVEHRDEGVSSRRRPVERHRSEPHRAAAHRADTHRREAHRADTHRREAHRSEAHRREAHRSEAHRAPVHRTVSPAGTDREPPCHAADPADGD